MEDTVLIRGARPGELLEIPREDLNSPARLRWWLNRDISTIDPVVENAINSAVYLRYKELTKPVERSRISAMLLRFRRRVNRLYWQDRIPYFAMKLVWRVTPNVGL